MNRFAESCPVEKQEVLVKGNLGFEIRKLSGLPLWWGLGWGCHMVVLGWPRGGSQWRSRGQDRVQLGNVKASTWKPSDLSFWLSLISSVQSPSPVWLFATPWTAACQASLSITNSQSFLKLMSIQSVMPSNYLLLCRSLLLLPSIFPSIRVFSNESALRIKWPK